MKIDVFKVAKLANIPLTKEETNLGKQLEETLSYIENLGEVKTENVEPTSQVTGLENVVREDKPTPSLSQKEALQNSRSTINGFFKVDAILEQ